MSAGLPWCLRVCVISVINRERKGDYERKYYLPFFIESRTNMIDEQIQELSRDIEEWHERVNTHGIWMFLATLGCWGVSQTFLRIIALIFVLGMFAYLISKGVEFKGSFDVRLGQIKEKIHLEHSDHDDLTVTGKARLYDLNKLKQEKLSVPHGLLRVSIGWVGIIFWVITLTYFLGVWIL